MKLVHPEIEEIIDTEKLTVPALVVENPALFRRFLLDLYHQTEGHDGAFVLSKNNIPLEFSHNAELLDNLIAFRINTRPLITRIVSKMEERAVSPEFFERSTHLTQELEILLDDITFDFPCSLNYTKLNISTFIRSTSVEVEDDYENLLERLIDYMELVREFDRDKLFITVNLRSCFEDSETETFLKTVVTRGYHVLMLECLSRELLPGEHRITIDNDLCEF